MTSKKNISIKEIAELAGVSVATVSRVINNNGRFSDSTRDKVQAIIKEYGYTTNMAARSLRGSQSKTVGLIVPNINNEWFSQVVLEIEKFFFDRNYSVFICNTSQDDQKEVTYFKSLDSKQVDGIICISGREELPVDVMTRDIPIICIDRKPREYQNAYYVESNHYNGGYQATEELIRSGCRNIAIVSRNKSLSVNHQRLEGYLAALADYKLPIKKEFQILLDTDIANYEGTRDAFSKLIAAGVKFDGVFATNDWRAYGVIVAATSHNLRVPEDIKVVGFDDIPIASACNPTISTVRQDIASITSHSCNLLLSLMKGEEVDQDANHFIIPVEVIPRESTRPKSE